MYTQFEEKTKNSETHFKEELNTLRTGRANPAIVSDMQVEAYGASQPLSQLANISVAGPRMLVIEPWDKSLVKEIEKAIIASDLGLAPAIDGTLIRITLPEMTEETRKDMVRVLKEKLEEVRVSIRNAREEEKKKIDTEKKAGTLTEDEQRNQIEDLDKKTKDIISNLESLADEKEKEVMTI
jgi:ribosome recycling factor